MLFGHFGIDDLRLLPLRLAILLGHVGHDFARVGSCPDRILDAIRGVGQNLELFISGAAGASSRRAAKTHHPPQAISPPPGNQPQCTPGVSKWAPTREIVSGTGDDGSLVYPPPAPPHRR